MAKIRILKENYADADLIVSQTYSSQLAAAPASNILAKIRRTKVWRSAGYWNITASNNVIKFKDSGGVLTATIAVAEYVTDATFLAAVDAALEAAGGNDYTVTRDTATKKIKITSNGAAFQLLCSNVGFTAKNILGYTGSSDLTGALTYTADTLKIHTSEFTRLDLGTASNVQAFALIGLRNQGIQLTSDAVVTLQGNTTDVWTSPQYEQVLDWKDDVISVFDVDGLFSGGLRYWRLEIEDPSNPDGYIEISKIYLGEIYVTVQGCVQFPLQSDYIDLSQTELSEMGVAFSNTIQKTQVHTLQWNNVTKTENEEFDDFISNYGTSFPFFISIDPEGVFSSDASKWIKYCRFNSMPRSILQTPNNFSSNWELREEL